MKLYKGKAITNAEKDQVDLLLEAGWETEPVKAEEPEEAFADEEEAFADEEEAPAPAEKEEEPEPAKKAPAKKAPVKKVPKAIKK